MAVCLWPFLCTTVVFTTIRPHSPLHPELFWLRPFLYTPRCLYNYLSPPPSTSRAVCALAVSLRNPLFLQPFVPTVVSIWSCSGSGRFSAQLVVCTTICPHSPLHPELFVLWPFLCTTPCFYSHSSQQPSPSGAVLYTARCLYNHLSPRPSTSGAVCALAVSLRNPLFLQPFVPTALFIRSLRVCVCVCFCVRVCAHACEYVKHDSEAGILAKHGGS